MKRADWSLETVQGLQATAREYEFQAKRHMSFAQRAMRSWEAWEHGMCCLTEMRAAEVWHVRAACGLVNVLAAAGGM